MLILRRFRSIAVCVYHRGTEAIQNEESNMRLRPAVHAAIRGFTLIEILVVVAIMALLLSILLPSLSNARAISKATVCGTQLNEIFSASLMYSQANDDRLPYFGWWDRAYTGREWWITQIGKNLGNHFDMYKCAVDQSPYDKTVVLQKGRLYMSLSNEPNRFQMDLSYRGACDTMEDLRTTYRARKITSWKQPYRAFLLVEANAVVTDTKQECFRFRDDMSHIADPQYVKKYPQLKAWQRHLGKTNFLFMDGHVDRLTPKQAVAIALRQEWYL